MKSKSFLFLFFISCLTPADKTFREKALLNETDSGFISREFFQIQIAVPLGFEEVSVKEKRELCKKRALVKRDKETIPYLTKVIQNKYRPFVGIETFLQSEQGREKLSRTATDTQVVGASPQTGMNATPQSSTTNSNSTNLFGPQSNNQNSLPEPEGETPEKPIAPNLLFLQSFGWFLDGLVLYKEDYSQKLSCKFIFRNIQKDLYAKVEAVELPTEALQEAKPNPGVRR